ncbi:purine-binding chemotaxis protein CheW [Natranaerovirga hydrolytica]|uniref:Purine-binding chemotaxis protein CheW n=1 Tax=Natranaerovirga hydrolytica TaxID=680378 RepID=A0A4R1M6R1_9FIRM|nr:chemotaxis protein CheW [Natranaerovirga hydrolytica]TCK87948.1 purine-binding chemotaxis protein CheW [Natranaerovirga hydrolytica]
MSVVQQVVFNIGKEEFGIDIIKVFVIEKYQSVVKIPNTPEYVEGVINLRGEALPIYNLRKRFNLSQKANDEHTKIIVTYTNDMKVGFVVDAVQEILNIEEENIENTPKIVAGINRHYIQGLAKVDDRMVILLDVDQLIGEEEQKELEQALEESKQ